MEIAEDLARLYQQLAEVSRARTQNQIGAEEHAEELLGQAEGKFWGARAPETRDAYAAFLKAAAMALARPQRAVAALDESEKRFPRELGPSLELAQAYTQTGRFDDALAACERAMGKSEGMTTLAVYSAREQILRLKGDTEAAEQTRAKAQQFACALPAPVAGSRMGRGE